MMDLSGLTGGRGRFSRSQPLLKDHQAEENLVVVLPPRGVLAEKAVDNVRL